MPDQISEKDLKLIIKPPLPSWASDSWSPSPSLCLQTSDEGQGSWGASWTHWWPPHGGWSNLLAAMFLPSLLVSHLQPWPLWPWFLCSSCPCHSRGEGECFCFLPARSPWHTSEGHQLLTHQDFPRTQVLSCGRFLSLSHELCGFCLFEASNIFRSLIKC